MPMACKLNWAVLLGLFLSVCTGARAEELKLVANGAAPAPIIIFKDAPPLTRQAADELALYIEKISGAKPQVIEGLPEPVPEHAIWVGYQPKLKELFPKVDFELKHPEEILIACDGKNLVIAGRDRWDPNCMTITRPRGKPVSIQQEYGTCNAVYTFLQDNLGVRWLWPGELGEDIIKKDTIALAPFEFRYHPQWRYRSGLFAIYSRAYRRGGKHDWIRFQRIVLDSWELEVGGHGFGDWWDKYHTNHPDYFALQPDGTRSGFPEPNRTKLCHANPAVWDQWIENVGEQLKENPFKTVFNASPNDSYASGHCVCTNCRAWDNPDGRMLSFHWKGLTQEYVSLTDRHITFANIVARKLKEKYPGKDYYVSMLAYGNWRPPPVKAVPDDNVLIVNVANLFWGTNAVSKEGGGYSALDYAAWGKVAKKQVWRPNTGDPAGWQKGLPDVPFGRRMEVFRFVTEYNCIGIFVDMVWNHWATQGPIYYMMAQMAWNPRADGRAILEDYYRRAYGPASAELKAYWEMMEQARDRKVDEFPEEGTGYAEVYDQKFFDRAYGLLDDAAKKVAGAPAKYSERIAFTRVGLDYTRLMADLRAAMAKVRQSSGKDAAADKQARELWAKIDKLKKEHPDALNWRLISPGSKEMMRGGGLHPDHTK